MAKIVPLFRYKRVAYFSVVIDDSPVSLYEEFVRTQETSNLGKLIHIQHWIKIIGEKYGAKQLNFRNESFQADTSALPPKGIDKEPCYFEHGKKAANSLRLYCLRANDNVVFLFGGSLKTAQKAQDCPNVLPHFTLANKLTKAIDEAFINGDIKWIDDDTMIEVAPDFELSL